MSEEIPVELIRFIQTCMSQVPAIVLGSGASMAFGMPGMQDLSKYLISSVVPEDSELEEWEKFKTELNEGVGLETALHNVNLNQRLEEEIIFNTRNLILEKDIEIRKAITMNNYNLPLSNLVDFLNTAASPNIKIVTTNYDRIAEYAVDKANLRQYTGFEGNYIRRFDTKKKKMFQMSKVVEILKVHGSVDWYKSSDTEIISLPDEFKDNDKFKPVMVTPGRGKYQHTHDEPFRSLITRVDEIFDEAKSILIIGFGFNDGHIQPKLVNKMRDSKTPILIIAKSLTPQAIEFIKSNENGKVYGIEDYETGARIISPKESIINVNKKIWDLKELIKLIL